MATPMITRIYVAHYLPPSVNAVMQHLDIDSDLHLTLLQTTRYHLFLDYDPEKVRQSFNELAQNFGPIYCRFTGVGLMKHSNECLVALVEMRRGAELYSRLLSECKKNWGNFGTSHDFLPHVTLRWNNKGRGLVPLEDVRSYSWTLDRLTVKIETSYDIPGAGEDFEISEDVLLKGESR